MAKPKQRISDGMSKYGFRVVHERGRWVLRKRGAPKSRVKASARAATSEEVALWNALRDQAATITEAELQLNQADHAIACRRYFVQALRSRAATIRAAIRVRRQVLRLASILATKNSADANRKAAATARDSASNLTLKIQAELQDIIEAANKAGIAVDDIQAILNTINNDIEDDDDI